MKIIIYLLVSGDQEYREQIVDMKKCLFKSIQNNLAKMIFQLFYFSAPRCVLVASTRPTLCCLSESTSSTRVMRRGKWYIIICLPKKYHGIWFRRRWTSWRRPPKRLAARICSAASRRGPSLSTPLQFRHPHLCREEKCSSKQIRSES